LPEPGADVLVSQGSGGKVEIEKAVGLARITEFIDLDAVLAESLGVRSPLVSEPPALSPATTTEGCVRARSHPAPQARDKR